MKLLAKILFILYFLFSSIYHYSLLAKYDDSYFVVTAYYSPLPNQDFYLKGNYKDELRLNGKGIRGASGKGVFSGMIAAPKNYSFGTKVYLEGIGVGSIEDRGGAIVNAGQRGYKHDRIDVWMGYGDEGLRRAIYWGKRKVKGRIISKSSPVSINVSSLASPLWATKKLKKVPSISKINTPIVKKHTLVDKYLSIFDNSLSGKKDIKKLQEVLQKLGMYDKEIGGNYKNLIDIIYYFQLDNKLIKSEFSFGAGYFGPKTREYLKKDYLKFKEDQKIKLEKQKEDQKIKLQKQKEIEELKKISEVEAKKKVSIIGNLKIGDISVSVRELQKALKNLGYFEEKDTAIFGPKTKQSLISYQLDKKIISSSKETSAGICGPKTISFLEQDLKVFIFEKKIEEKSIEEIL